MILWEEHNGIGIITMDAPGKNALSVEDVQAFVEMIEAHKKTMKGLIVTGKNQSFCSGLSLEDNQFAESFPLLDKLLLTLYELDVPVVCAMPGHAIGAGLLMMCCADMVYATASDRAKFGLPEVKLNCGIDELMLEVLRERLGQKQLQQLLLTGEYVSQKTLAEWGVVNEVFENEEEMIKKAVVFVESMNAHRKSYAFTKRLLKSRKYMKMNKLLLCECWERLAELVYEK